MVFIPNTFGLTIQADRLISWPAQAGQFNAKQNYLVVGSGSNLLFTDTHFNGQIIQVDNQTFNIRETDTHYEVTLGAGLNWHQTVKRLVEAGVNGLENLALIPGTVGAAPIQNIGAYGVEFSQVCDSVTGFDIKSGNIKQLSATECKFAYRESIFKHALKDTFIITEVILKLPKNWQANIQYGPLKSLNNPTAGEVFERVCQIRQEKLPDPVKLGNAGSFFKNPVISQAEFERLKVQDTQLPHYPQDDGSIKLAAGYLIDKAGLKGLRYRQAEVHQQQALVLVNLGEAIADDMIQLAAHVRQKVYDKYQVRLTPEVRFIGANGEVDAESLLEQHASTGLSRNS